MSIKIAAVDDNMNLPAAVRAKVAANMADPATVEGIALRGTLIPRAEKVPTVQQRFGRNASRSIRARIGGRTAAFGSVTTALTGGAESGNLPLAERTEACGLIHSADGITIPADATPQEYDISWAVNFTAASAGGRQARLRLNGSIASTAYGYGTNVQVVGSLRRKLYAGDVLQLRAFSDTAASAVASGEYDIYLLVRPVSLPRVRPVVMGWSGSVEPAGLEGKREIHAHWLGAPNWSAVGGGGLAAGSTYDWIVQNRQRAVDFATHLIPVEEGSANWSALMDEGISGARDDIYQTLGTNLAVHGPATVYWRPWWEFNMQIWRPDAARFVALWQRVAPIVRAAFAAAARPGQVLKIAWCISGTDDAVPYWPGSQHVDIISLDTYGAAWGTTQPNISQITRSIDENFAYAGTLAAAYGKPFGVSEWANVATKADGPTTTRGLGDEPKLIDYFMDKIEHFGAEFAVYFNLAGGGVDLTLSTAPNSRARLGERRALVSVLP